MKKISYSIAIRTLGTGGEKYERLLESIKQLEIQPEQIIVVLPEGAKPPTYSIGKEVYKYSRKGMVFQRVKAMQFIESDYILFCDDDVEFEPLFINKLVEPLVDGEYDCAAGPLLEFFPPKGIKYWVASLLGGASIMIHGRKKDYVRILGTGGWSYNPSVDINQHKIYSTESLAGTCFFIKSSVMRSIKFEEEIWLEHNGYAAFEDRVMFYKMHQMGYRSCVVSDAKYIHNDGQTSIRNLKMEPLYARAFNHYIFWHKFIYSFSNSKIQKVWKIICIEYYMKMQIMYGLSKRIIGRETAQSYEVMKQGFKDAKIYVSTRKYREIEEI